MVAAIGEAGGIVGDEDEKLVTGRICDNILGIIRERNLGIALQFVG